jgi:NADPH-dependent 2,4-dienoyl-CoA reductase/sulfur reductase-like enzyme
VNPRFRRENRVPYHLEKTENPKKVVVIGGGPAGMKAALTACEKGHYVTLIEKNDRLGGIINVSDHGGYKKELNNYKNYLVHQVEKSNIQVLLNTEATFELVDNMHPDGLIIAVGAEPIVPNIPGVEHAEKLIDTYQHFDEVQGKVVVIGGGAIGSEAALEMAENGRDVTVVEMTDTLCAKENWLYRIALRQHIEKCPNFHGMMESRVIEVREDGVMVEDKDGQQTFVKADHVLMAVGMKSKKDVAFQFYGITPNTTMIGDCRRVGHVLDCTNDAYFVAANI